ncbi:MAG: GHKL domain-containing protein [Bacilli bacterium]|nr:GHKL domain-containing protein [Bacilli bacterium]
MRKRIGLELILAVCVALTIFLIGSFLLVRNNLNKITEFNLRYYLEIVKTDYDSGLTADDIIDKYVDIEEYLRITFMDSSGEVIADSSATDLENHLTRPEFMVPGETNIRESATLNKRMMYLAYQFSDTNYVRVSVPLNSVLPFLNDFIALSILIAMVIALGVIFLSKPLIDKTLAPFKDLRVVLNDVYQGKYRELLPVSKYEEINGILIEINDLNQMISNNIATLNKEKQKIDFLLEHMNQGLCVLDGNENIILVNEYLKSLFKYKTDNHLFQNYSYLLRDTDLQQAVAKVYKTKGSYTTVIEIDQAYFSVIASYVEKDWTDQSAVVLIFTDVTVLKNIEILKRDFFVNASHELKSPLTAIMGSADLIASGLVKDKEEIVDLSRRILEESNRMNQLVLDMLNLSKYENYIPLKANINVNLQDIVHEVIDKASQLAKAKNITIYDESVPVLFNANQEHLEQLLRNLVENSIQYGNDSGYVKIKVFEDDEKVHVEVEDNGIGIPNSEQSRVFERFYRVDKARSKKSGGTGLGLSIVKHIVMIYQGKIEVESSEGKGTRMRIVFPKSQS